MAGPLSTTQPSDLVSILIDGFDFAHWTEVEVTLSMDTFSTVQFTSPFESSRREFREVFEPFKFKPLEVRVDGSTLFNGIFVAPAPTSEANSTSITVSGYSIPGVLAECPIPARYLPVQFNDLKLNAIAAAVSKPWGIVTQFDADDGAPFKKAKLEKDTKIYDFLVELARQRSLIISSTPDGKLLCQQSVSPGNPVALLVDGTSPVSGVSSNFDPASYFSEITGFAKTKKKRAGSSYTLTNPWLMDVLRPSNFDLSDTDPADVPAAVAAKLGRMFANTASWSVDLAGWRDPSGALWAPNTTVSLLAPDAMVYRDTELIIRSVLLSQNAGESTASLDLVLPGAFSGEAPEVLPWTP